MAGASVAIGLVLVAATLSCSGREAPSSEPIDEVTAERATPPDPAAAAARPAPPPSLWSRRVERTLRVATAAELAAADLSSTRTLDVAFSADDQIGVPQQGTTEQRCAQLELAPVMVRAPVLEHLRVSGCQAAIGTSLARFARRLETLELADIALDRAVIDQLSRLSRLQTLILSRVTATEASLAPLHRLQPRALELRMLARDSAVGDLVGFWPRSLRKITLEGEWAGHNTMLRVADAKALRELRLINTRVGNYSLNQIKPLEHLRVVDWAGSTFNDNSPLYFRDLPIERFRCACPRLGDGGMRSLRHSKGLRVLELPESRITGGSLVHLAGLTQLEELTVLGRDIGEQGHQALAKLPSLRRLALGNVEVETSEMVALGELTKLRELSLNHANLNDDVGAALAKLVHLERLDLSETAVSDAVLPAIGQMHDLRKLQLHHTRVTNRGLQHLAALDQLRILELDHTDVVDDGVAHLAGLEELRELRLDATLVTDRAIDTILHLRHLERLNLANTVISHQGAARLAVLPHLRAVNLANTRATTSE